VANLFDPAQSPTTEPEKIVVGDFIQWRRTDLSDDYPNTLYTANYVARIAQGGSSEIQLPSTVYGEDYLFTVDSETSTDFNVGYYHWQLEIIRISDGNRIVIERGSFTAIADLDVNGADPRSHAEIMVDKIQTILEGKADSDVSSYSINGRSLTKFSPSELLEWRDYYKKEFAKEKRAEMVALGKKTNSTILMRFQ
jgi:hypothetical protein